MSYFCNYGIILKSRTNEEIDNFVTKKQYALFSKEKLYLDQACFSNIFHDKAITSRYNYYDIIIYLPEVLSAYRRYTGQAKIIDAHECNLVLNTISNFCDIELTNTTLERAEYTVKIVRMSIHKNIGVFKSMLTFLRYTWETPYANVLTTTVKILKEIETLDFFTAFHIATMLHSWGVLQPSIGTASGHGLISTTYVPTALYTTDYLINRANENKNLTSVYEDDEKSLFYIEHKEQYYSSKRMSGIVNLFSEGDKSITKEKINNIIKIIEK